ncbi:MAG: peptidylprolyl isomerase, partial [Aridibacter sp.]
DIDWWGTSSFVAGLSEAADLEDNGEDVQNLRKIAKVVLDIYVKNANLSNTEVDKSFPEVLNAYAKYKPDDLPKVLQDALKYDDVIIRSTAANLLGEIKPENSEQATEIYQALTNALSKARMDKLNDASLAILDALKKQYDYKAISQTEKFPYFTPFISAMESPDYLIRGKAAEIYTGFNTPKPDPMTVGNPDFKPYEIPKDIGVVKFLPDAKDGAKSRVVRADYKRALSRKNGEVKAILKTDKGEFTINFFPEEAPLTVDNFIKLAKSGYFDGLEIHRVVPNFVVQDGDPRGDGSGGPGWQIRDEINQLQYERGTVGMALSGKDTGGSQWFVTHSPQPHLDGGYTIFGKVNENDMKVVDNLVRGDKILSVKIIEGKNIKKR